MRLVVFLLVLITQVQAYSQQKTVGLLKYEDGVDEGLKLFTSVNDRYTYLINSCGEVINEWISEAANTKLVSYLMDNGNLISAIVVNDGSFIGPGKTGRLEIVNWDNELLWSTDFTGDGPYGMHHDIEVMPKGNILLTLWDRVSKDEAIALGRDSLLISGELWPETIMEIAPVYPDTFTIEWQWNLRDHIVQDIDSTLPNYGVISDNPHLVDINYLTDFEDDWIHANAISYNPARDEIMLSSRGFDEIWVIDHSTTTEEASGHIGGQSGRGGDLLFRFGNPVSHGVDAIQLLDGQHDIRLIDQTDSLATFTVFNNNDTDPNRYSELVIFKALLDSVGQYQLSASGDFIVSDSIFRFDDDGTFDSRFMSSFELLPNGHYLVCSAIKGLYLEYDSDFNEIWRYASPINLFGIASQGDSTNGTTFKLIRYSSDDPIFDGLDLSAKAKSIETGNIEYLCDQLTSLANPLVKESDFISFYQNPIANQLNISFHSYGEYRINVFGVTAQLEDQFDFKGTELKHYLKGQAGLKTILIEDKNAQHSFVIKILKID